jgi:hypothetical protein
MRLSLLRSTGISFFLLIAHILSAQGIGSGPSEKVLQPTNYALVVGVSDYVHLPPLMYADDDAFLFAEYLVNSNSCKKSDVRLLTDSAATKPIFFKELKRILDKSQSGDKVFIYFAGHGDVENAIETGFYYFTIANLTTIQVPMRLISAYWKGM